MMSGSWLGSDPNPVYSQRLNLNPVFLDGAIPIRICYLEGRIRVKSNRIRNPDQEMDPEMVNSNGSMLLHGFNITFPGLSGI